MALHRIGDAAPMDELTYTYAPTDNRLQRVDDQVVATACSTDVDAMATDFTYYRNGNLQNDPTANIANILWHPNGKLNAIIRDGANDSPTLVFSYDGLGNRVRKVQVARDASGNTLPMAQWDLTYYIRDAQGNHITTIERDFTDTDEFEATDELNISETVLYGSDRLGTRGWVKSDDTYPAPLIVRHPFTHSGVNESGEYTAITPSGSPVYSTAPEDYFSSLEGAKHYELKNHLGNVLATVSDKRDVEVDGSNNVENYTAKISDVSFYYPFGSLMPGLSDFGGEHRYGFNGQEKDNEMKGVGNHLDFKFRGYDPRLGRFLSIDPLFKNYPWNSSYAFAENDVIRCIDLEGLEKWCVSGNQATLEATFVAFKDNVPTGMDINQKVADHYSAINKDLSTKTFGLSFDEKKGKGFGNDKYTVQFDVNVLVVNDENELSALRESYGNRFAGVVLFGTSAEFQGREMDLDENSAGQYFGGENGTYDVLLIGEVLPGVLQHEQGHDFTLGHFGSKFAGGEMDLIGIKGRIEAKNGESYNTDGFMAPRGGTPSSEQIRNMVRGLPVNE